jgi:hypothetical protein
VTPTGAQIGLLDRSTSPRPHCFVSLAEAVEQSDRSMTRYFA